MQREYIASNSNYFSKKLDMRFHVNGLEFEQAPGDGEGQGGLACCSPWGHEESDTTGRVNNHHQKELIIIPSICICGHDYICTWSSI